MIHVSQKMDQTILHKYTQTSIQSTTSMNNFGINSCNIPSKFEMVMTTMTTTMMLMFQGILGEAWQGLF